MNYTAEMVLAEVEADRVEMLESLEASELAPPFMKRHPHFQDTWCAGCWLHAKLLEQGCSEERAHKIGFEHGQRSFHGSPYKWAAALFNAFCAGTLQEKPGSELALELLEQHCEMRDGTLVLKVGSLADKAQLEAELERFKAMTPEEREAELQRREEEILAVEEDLHA